MALPILYHAETNEIIKTLGAVDYVTGLITLNGLIPVGYPVGVFDIRINATLQEKSSDVSVTKNQVISLDDTVAYDVANRLTGLSINVVAV